MAAAEARAAWQRTANRYFVQEDAKRAPKLACCPPSTFSSKQTNSGPTSATDSPDHRAVGFMPSKLAPSYSNLPYDAQWWLQMEPHYAIHRGLNFDQSKSLPMTSSSDSLVRETATMSEESTRNVDYGDLESFFEVKKSHELGPEELGVGHDKIDQDFLDLKNMTDYCESLDLEMVGGSVSKQTCEFSSGAGCLSGGEKMPWWRVTDEAELASIVAQKSLHHIGNCDLPPPQKRHVRREQPYKQGSSVDHDEIFLSSLDWGAQSNAISSPSSGGSVRKHWSSLREGPSHNENAAAEPLSRGTPEKERNPMSDPCKAKLLEALCHSQTRAREAEKAAKQAYTEKEDLLKLFFRQASQLFAYKQWLKLLQLEALLLESKESDPSLFTTFPDLLPWMPQNPRKLHKNWQKSAKAKRRKRVLGGNNDIGRYCVAFAVGFTLVGAGLILGWTVGWLLPTF